VSATGQEKRSAAIARAERKVLSASSKRFDSYLRERHYKDEEAVLRDVIGFGEANILIRAVAQWRIAKRSTRRGRK
jgi:hypothetical protein